jgi:serine/threonine protein phosphatase PrpC
MSIGAIGRESNTGNKRRRNEDSFVVAPPLFAVADGMGGAQAGEVASKLAAAALEDTDLGSTHGEERVIALIQAANRRVYERSNADPTASGMGTTITVALVEGTRVTFGHVGDSRAYLLRDGVMEQLTEDHSLVNELMKTGKLSPEEAETHPQRSVITRALGTDPDVDVDTFVIEAKEGDLFLICSDGLTTMVADEDILELLERNHDDLDRAAKSLVAAANRAGGEDNITVVAFTIRADGGDTVTMPAAGADDDTIDGMQAPSPVVDTMVVPADQVEEAFLVAGSAEALAAIEREPIGAGARIRLVLAMLALLALAAVLLIWGLLR